MTVDFPAHRITSVGIVDLHTGESAQVNPSGWYLTGGAFSGLGFPAAIRIFTGGNAGNATAWDNILVVPAPAGALALAVGGLLIAARRRRITLVASREPHTVARPHRRVAFFGAGCPFARVLGGFGSPR